MFLGEGIPASPRLPYLPPRQNTPESAYEGSIEAAFSAAIRIANEQKSIAGETCGRNLRGVPSPKSELVRRTRIPKFGLAQTYAKAAMSTGLEDKNKAMIGLSRLNYKEIL